MSDDRKSSKDKFLERLRETIQPDFPDLQVIPSDRGILLKGSFPVGYQGKIVDRYQVEIQVSRNFPESIPILRETGGRIPWVPDRHFNQNGEACVLVPEEWMLHPDSCSLNAFLKGPVHNFFVGQSLVERGEPWPFGERPHGRAGLLESYKEMLGIDTEAVVLLYLDSLSSKDYKGHHRCPCGSDNKIRNCHKDQILQLRERIPYLIAKKALMRLHEHKK